MTNEPPVLSVADGPPGLCLGRGTGMSFRHIGKQVNAAFRRVRAPSLAWRRRKPDAKHNLWALF